MSVLRYRIIYPDSVFRGMINSKNVAPPEDHWAEGALCRGDNGELIILNRKCSDGYGACNIYSDTLGLCSGFADGDRHDIFEGDIVSVKHFSETAANENSSDSDSVENIPDDVPQDESGEQPERTVYSDIPENALQLDELRGVIYMNGGMFWLQFFDVNTGMLTAAPLASFFWYDMLPAPNTAVKVIGNIYDNEDLYGEVLHIPSNNMECVQY